MSVKSYDAGSVLVILNGVIVEGIADGTFLTAARDNPAFTKGTGSGGEGWRAKSNDRSGTVTLTLLQTSATNDLFSALMALDEQTGNGVGALLIKDNSGLTLISAESAWLEKPADAEFAREVSNREWTIGTNDLNMHNGGN